MIDVETLATLKVPGPTGTSVSAPFWQGLAEGRFLLQHCRDCDHWVFYPRGICPHCWSPALTWREAGGRGRLATWSVQHRPGHPGWQPAAPYALGLVRLEEGPTMLSQILVPPDRLALDLPLRLRIVTIGETALPFFEAAT
jgi:uncharacterized OB-fold protein